MALTAQGTHKPIQITKDAITITADGQTFALSHAQVSSLTEAQIETALNNLVAIGNVELPTIYVHINDDDSLALALGAEPDVWPEDRG